MRTTFISKSTASALLLLFILSSLHAQGITSDSLVSKKQNQDTVKQINDTVSYDFILINQKLLNRYTFLGRNFGQRNPLASTSLFYYFHSNFWMGLSGFKFLDDNIPFQTGLSTGYYKEFSQRTDWAISYAHFFVPDQKAKNSQGVLQTTFGLDWTVLYSTIQGMVFVNQTPDIVLSTQHSRYFQFNKKLWKKIKVSFEPKFLYSFGSSRFYGAGQVASPGGGVFTPSGDTTNTKFEIKPMYWEAFIPLKFSGNRLVMEWGARYVSPLNTIKGDPSKPNFVFSIDLTFYIPVRRKFKL